MTDKHVSPMKLVLSEKAVQSSIIEYLNLKGHFVWRNNTGMARIENRAWYAGLKGSADIIGVAKDSRFIAVECKKKGNKPSPFQKSFLHEISRRGGYSIVAYSLEDVQKEGL